MNAIQLLYAANVISRRRGVAQQELTFYLLVENWAHEKQIEIRWSGEDGAWRTIVARHLCPAGDAQEIWCGQAYFRLSPDAALPGNIRFALRSHMAGSESWDNHGGADYTLEADSGVLLPAGVVVRHLGFQPRLQAEDNTLDVAVAVDGQIQPKEVFVEWSADGWRTVQRVACSSRRDYWERTEQSNARNPNQYGVCVWTARIRVKDLFRLEYAVGCRTADGEHWDNNGGRNFTTRRNDLTVLVLNLHCRQEPDQDAKLSTIARAIGELGVDVVCFQEVAEHWNEGRGDWESNTAKIINDRLDQPYHLYTDWAHRGFEHYREGVAILSRYPLTKQEARYISQSRDAHDIHARKAVMGQIDVPHIGLINLFSAHLSWWSDGFQHQFDALAAWAKRRQTKQVTATLLCGDFNIKAGSPGYSYVLERSDFADQYLAVTDPETFQALYVRKENDWRRLDGDPRIDYIFMNRAGALKATAAQLIFTDQAYGRVSDHIGYLIRFEPK